MIFKGICCRNNECGIFQLFMNKDLIMMHQFWSFENGFYSYLHAPSAVSEKMFKFANN